MNEQPFRDPVSPPTANVAGRDKLTQQIQLQQETVARCIAENNPKGAAIALQHQQILLLALMCDELQATQQMFERIDKKLSDLPQALRTTAPVRGTTDLPRDPILTSEQQEPFNQVTNILNSIIQDNRDDLSTHGSQILLDALHEWMEIFVG